MLHEVQYELENELIEENDEIYFDDQIDTNIFPIELKTEIDELLLNVAISGDEYTMEDIIYGNNYLNINAKNDKNETSLIICCKYGYLNCVKLLLRNKNTILTIIDNNGNTALHIAIQNKFIDIIQLLLQDWRIEINLVNQLMETPLHLLANWGEPSLIQLVTNYTNLNPNKINYNNETSFMILVKNYQVHKEKKYLDCIDILLKLNNIDIRFPENLDGLDEVLERIINYSSFDINSALNSSHTLLTYSCYTSNIKLFNNLLSKKNIDINKYLENRAINIALKEYNFELFNILSRRDEVIIDKKLIDSLFIDTFLTETIIKYCKQFLLMKKIDKITIIDYSLRYSNLDVLKEFIDSNIDYILPNGEHILIYCLKVFPKAFYYLLSLNNNPNLNNISNNQGDSLLHIAILNNHEKAIKLLINRGISCNIRNIHGVTPLELCLNLKKLEYIDILLDKTNITFELQIRLLELGISKYIILKYSNVYGSSLGNMPERVYFNIINSINKYKNNKEYINKLVEFLLGININILELQKIYNKLDLELSHNQTDPATLELFKKYNNYQIIQYGIPIDNKYRTIYLDTLLEHTKQTGYGYLRDILDPLDRSQMYNQVVYSTKFPIYIDCLLRHCI